MTDTEPSGERDDALTRPASRRPRFLWIAAAAVATVVIVTSGAFLLWPEDDRPDDARTEVLEAFFDALAARDTATALSLVQPDSLPAQAHSRFLVPEAVGAGSRLLNATVLEDGDDVRKIHAEFSTPSGEARGDYDLYRQDDGEWLLGAVFTPVVFPSSPAAYVQVNDLLLPASELHDDPRQYVFPGVYEFYRSVPDVVEVRQSETVELFWPQSFQDSIDVAVPEMSLEPEALGAVQDALDDLVAECLDQSATALERCPFGLGDDREIEVDGRMATAAAEGAWTLDHEPTVTGASFDHRTGSGGFVVETDLPDLAVSLAVHVNGQTVTAACGFDPNALAVELRVEDGAVAPATTPRAADAARTACEAP